jgi:hypothetical protein
MACTSRYAESWEFAAFSCPGNILKGQDRSGGGPNASLSDSQANFSQVQANKGYVLYNLTTGLSGVVTAVTTTTLTATGVLWTNGQLYRIALLSGVEISAIETMLDIAASDMHVALAAANACSCTFATWANAYLAKLNIIDAQVFYNCSCGNQKLSEEEKARLQTWVNDQLNLIRTGNLELCSGETGSDFPSIDWAEQSSTDFAAAEILINRA